MAIGGIILPDLINSEREYAVAVPIRGRNCVPIQSYETLEELKEGYKKWQKFAAHGGLTRPIPIKFLGKADECKILIDLLKEK